jgi:hypothetical protein
MSTQQRGSGVPRDQELLQRVQVMEAMLGITGANAGNGPSVPNPREITGNHVIRDASGLLRVKVGQLPSGDYGYLTQDPSGNANELWPTSSGFELGGSVSGTSPTSLGANSPTVDAYLGASGDAIVTCSASIYAASSALVANAYLVIDSDEPADAIILELRALAGLGVSCSASIRLSDWWVPFGGVTPTPNSSHTFSLLYSVTTSAANFGNIMLMVEPL